MSDTKLGKVVPRAAASPAPQGDQTALARAMAFGSRGEEVTLPVLGRAYIQLAPADALNEVESEVYAEMTRLGLPASGLFGLTYDREKLVRLLARVVRDPDDPTREKRFGTPEEWATKVDEDVIVACSNVYHDVRIRLDPVGAEMLTNETAAFIDDALQKKNATALRSCGVAMLAQYLLTGDARREMSQTPGSSNGESSSEIPSQPAS